MRVKFTDSKGQARVEEMVVLGGGTTAGGSAAGLVVVADRPAYPSQNYLEWDGLVGAADNDVLYTSADVSGYNFHSIENRSAVAIDVFVTKNGTFNASQPARAVNLTDDVTTGKAYSITIPANKTGEFEGKYKNIQVRQAAAGAITAGTVVGSHGVA